MANLLINGFEQDDATSVQRDWSLLADTITVVNTGRRSTNCVRFRGSGRLSKGFPSTTGTMTFGFALLVEAIPTVSTSYIASVTDGTNITMSLAITTAGTLVSQSAGATYATGTKVLAPSTWYYIEWVVKVADSGGIAQVYIDGSSTPDLDFSGDTRFSTNGANIQSFAFGSGAGSNAVYCRVGDFYANDDSGSSPDNGRWGDTKVTAIVPNAAGASNTLVSKTTGTAAATNVNEVDDPGSSDDDSTYVSGTSGLDLYNFPALGYTAASIRAVCTRITAKKLDASARTVAATVHSGGGGGGGSNFVSTAQSIGTSYTVKTFLHPVDPATSTTWTQSNLEAAQFGVTVA